jgi:hypothetical protein
MATARKLNQELLKVPRSQVERLSYIEARLYFLGELQRQDVSQRFAVASVQASRDLSLYKRLAPENLDYDYRARTYLPSASFNRIFELSTEGILWWLRSGLGDGVPHPQGLSTASVDSLCIPDANTLASVTRAIYRKLPIEISYISLSSGSNTRQIVPHALVDSGKRWHVRAYDRKNNRFSDFVINRINGTRTLEAAIESNELPVADLQWGKVVELIIGPHPKIAHKAAVEADFRMTGGKISISCRAAVAGYLLRRWGVDCSIDNRLNSDEFHLSLLNTDSLLGVESAELAPGFGK